MKVLHISTSDRGGAANAALRLHQGLLKSGVDSKFLCLLKSTNHIPKVYSFEPKPLRLFSIGLRKLGLYKTQSDKNQKKIKHLNGDYEIFTFPQTDYDIISHPLVQEADIINLHWVANFLDWPSFFRKVHKPIVWTLHDMNPFQGGFHYYQDVENNQSVFGNIEVQLRKIKLQALTKINNVTITSPSNWLEYESRNGYVLGKFPHQHIPYGLDTQIFQPFDQFFARNVFQLPQQKKILLFVADSLNNLRKGMDLLNQALLYLPNKNITVVTVGSGKLAHSLQTFEYIHLGRIWDERLMALAYSTADLFVIPSREDNLPNTVLESLSCGTPVVGFNIGGIPDMVKNEKNGFLAPKTDSASLAQTIAKALVYPFDHDWIRTDAMTRFDQTIQAKSYIKLYQSILDKKID